MLARIVSAKYYHYDERRAKLSLNIKQHLLSKTILYLYSLMLDEASVTDSLSTTIPSVETKLLIQLCM